jgi:DNA-binding NarL/FixJ family response regulator
VLIGEAPLFDELALAAWLAGNGGVAVAGAESDAGQLLALAGPADWDLALLDFNSLRGVSDRTIVDLKALHGSGRVLVLCSDVSRPVLRAVLRAGVDGYVVRLGARDELAAIVHRVAGGESFFGDEIAAAFHDPDLESDPYTVLDPGDWDLDHPAAADPEAPVITRRERDIIGMVAVGCGNRLIAERLGISLPTVRKHRENLMRKLGLHNAAEVTAYAIAHGLAARG